MKSKQAKAHEFSQSERQKIVERDHGECIFCKARYRMDGAGWYELTMKSIMHYIPRSQGGLGIEKNGAVGCQWHHHMLDNGNDRRREEMLEIFEKYLRQQYQDWNSSEIVYDKWRFLQ